MPDTSPSGDERADDPAPLHENDTAGESAIGRTRHDRGACERGICVCHPFCELRRDERAIEGLPVRLVIALVVGVASLSVMLSMVSGIQGLAVTELDAQPEPEVTTPGQQDLDVAVVDPDGSRVADATVIVRAGSARLDGVATATTDADGMATLSVDPSLGPNQPDGTLRITIKPPAGSDYADDRENTAVLVVED